MDVRVVGVELPGRRCRNQRGEVARENVHVGIQRRQAVIELVPGDAPQATWDLSLDWLGRGAETDFRGPYVHGRRGDRYLYLSWGVVDADGRFEMFRRAKLCLDELSEAVLAEASRPGHRLVATVGLTGPDGTPRCAAVRPPAVRWTAAA